MKELDFRLEKLLFNLDALADLGDVLTSPEDSQRVVRSSLYMIMGTFSASAGAIFQYDKKKSSAKPVASKGIGDNSDMTMGLSDLAVREMIDLKRPIDLVNAGNQPPLDTIKADMEKVQARIIAPLVVSRCPCRPR